MRVFDLFRVTRIGQEIIIKDYNKGNKVIYKGDAENIPLCIIYKNIRWVGSSDVYVGTLEFIIE